MPWQCKMIDPAIVKDDDRKPGDMWFAPWMIDSNELSRQYHRGWRGQRPSIVVQIPDGYPLMIDSQYSRSDPGGDEVLTE
jgi:hypothetical protein